MLGKIVDIIDNKVYMRYSSGEVYDRYDTVSEVKLRKGVKAKVGDIISHQKIEYIYFDFQPELEKSL